MPRRKQAANPAQRLFDVLRQHDEALGAKAAHGYDPVWAQALNIPLTR